MKTENTSKTIKFLDSWFVQRTDSGNYRLVSSSGTYTSNIQYKGKDAKSRPLLEEGDLVETKNTIYRLGTPVNISETA